MKNFFKELKTWAGIIFLYLMMLIVLGPVLVVVLLSMFLVGLALLPLGLLVYLVKPADERTDDGRKTIRVRRVQTPEHSAMH